MKLFLSSEALRSIGTSSRHLRPSAEVRVEIANRLHDLDFQHWAPISEQLAKDPSSRVRAATAMSAGLCPGTEVGKLLQKLSKDGSWKVRHHVAIAAGREPDPWGLPILEALLTDPVEAVRLAALRSLLRYRTLLPDLTAGRDRPMRRVDIIDLLEDWKPRDLEARLEPNPWQARRDFAASIPRGPGPLSGASREAEVPQSGLPLAAVPTPASRPEKGAPPAPERYVNSWFQGHPSADRALDYRTVYKVCIQVSPEIRFGSHTQGKPEFSEPGSTEPSADVVVALVSDDFDIVGPAAKRMALPTDLAKNSPIVDFRVRPSKNNQQVFLHVLFFRGNALFHEAVIGARSRAGAQPPIAGDSAVFQTEQLYRAEQTSTVDVNLQVVPHTSGYRIVLFSDDGSQTPPVFSCHVSITRSQVASLLEALRDDILEALQLQTADGVLEFYDAEPPAQARQADRLPQPRVATPKSCQKALRKLARVGRRIQANLFDSARDPAERDRANELHARLHQLSAERQLRLQVLSEDFSVPWNFIYDGPLGNELDASFFWGFRHVIEEIPYRVQPPSREELTREGEVLIGLNLNRKVLKDVLIDPQVTRLGELLAADEQLEERTSEEEVLEVLSGERGHGRIEYFYCHAGAEGDLASKYEQSYLGLTGAQGGLTLEQIKLSTFGHRFDDRALFILNACESAQMDGRFYDGFVPRLLTMGAVAVVGTECKVPEVLGAHLGVQLVERLLAGGPLGSSLLEARRDFLERHNNPFGLLYRSFGNSDIHFRAPGRSVPGGGSPDLPPTPTEERSARD